METCVRGFSFMPESKADLQYIEGGELERTWRTTRRERAKQREQMIWDNFVKEQDLVKGVCKDDPYQFLDELPESCMLDLKEEADKMKMCKENTAEEIKTKTRESEQSQQGTSDKSTEDTPHSCLVTFADDIDKEDCDMFHIFDDEPSGPEDDVANDPATPDTVREKSAQESASSYHVAEGDVDLHKSSSKSSENVASVIESSIYCARVRELRQKICEELSAMMTSLSCRDILFSSEPEDIARMIKRSAEFCTRFNRIYMYQLQRQIHDIKRNNNQTLPFAKHTQFQSQMTRIVTLHQNLLGSFQVFHKSFSQTCCVRESAGALGSLLAAVRDSTHMCLNVPPPRDFAACLDLYKDDLLPTCDKLDEFVNEYAIRCEEFLNRFDTSGNGGGGPKKVKKENKPKRRIFNNKHPINSSTESQLSMYSMDTIRLNLNAKSSSSKDTQLSNTVKMLRIGAGSTTNTKKGAADKNVEPPKSSRKSRRPLMRDPHAGRPRAPKPARDTDIRTLVEAVETCASNHLMTEDSPRTVARQNKRSPTQRAQRSPHASQNTTPVRATPQTTPQSTPQVTPRENVPENVPNKPLPSPSTASSKPKSSPSKSKPRQKSPRVADSPSCSKLGQDDELTPVLTIKCAMKKDLKAGESRHGHRNKDSVGDSGSRRLSGSPNCGKKRLSPIRREDLVSPSGTNSRMKSKHGECSKDSSPRTSHPGKSGEPVGDRNRVSNVSPERNEVSRLLKQLCSGDTTGKTERVAGAKNVQLVYVSGSSPRQPSTPQLLRILEETIKKKVPKPLQKPPPARAPDRYRLLFNIAETTADALFQYRTKFVQHMLTSSMYANSAVGKPWEMIGNVSENIIDDVLVSCLKDMELREVIEELYKKETS